MKIGEIKRAVYQLKKFCENQSKCAACPFRIRSAFSFNMCRFNQFGYVGAFPREWKVNDFANNDD